MCSAGHLHGASRGVDRHRAHRGPDRRRGRRPTRGRQRCGSPPRMASSIPCSEAKRTQADTSLELARCRGQRGAGGRSLRCRRLGPRRTRDPRGSRAAVPGWRRACRTGGQHHSDCQSSCVSGPRWPPCIWPSRADSSCRWTLQASVRQAFLGRSAALGGPERSAAGRSVLHATRVRGSRASMRALTLRRRVSTPPLLERNSIATLLVATTARGAAVHRRWRRQGRPQLRQVVRLLRALMKADKTSGHSGRRAERPQSADTVADPCPPTSPPVAQPSRISAHSP